MTATTSQVREGRPETIRAVPVRHPWRWVGAAGIGILVAMLINSFLTNDVWNWSEQWTYIVSEPVLNGVKNTLWLTVVAMAGGVVLGILLAVMRLSRNPVLSGAAWFYIWFFRGTPLYTQLLLWGSIGALYQTVGIGLPFGPMFVTADMNQLYSAAAAAALGLLFNEAAYMSEIVRAGIISVDEGQTEAAASLGMTSSQTMRRVVLPQAMRVIVPPTGNEVMSMLKNTSLVAAIPYLDLTFSAQSIYARTYQIIPMLVMACLWYLLMSSALMIGQFYLERHFAKGTVRNLPPTPIQRVRLLFSAHGRDHQ